MFNAYVRKELLEIARNYKLYIVIVVFVMIGFSNPIFAKLTPYILASMEYQINIPEPTVIDSWIQFYKNISTLLIVYIILFSTIISNEINSNSLINMFTKGLARKTVVLSKFAVISCLWIVAYYFCFLTTYLYTPLLLEGTLDNVLIASILPCLLGIFLISLSILGGVTTKSAIGSLLTPMIIYILLSLVSIIDAVKEYVPTYLMSSINLITGSTILSDYALAFIITSVLTILVIVVSIVIFDKQSI